MRKKIIGILVCMLLIGTTGVVVADWEVGEPYKMHYPQLPDPNGVDVDWGNWELADDWKCTECGPVEDIHFWISWFDDDPVTIPSIDVSIWTNNPQGPGGYSQPLDKKWERKFYAGDFIIAGPWDGEQLWYLPWGETIPQPHYQYWQINIKDIDDPFEQTEGEIYWLVIKMPFDDTYINGWKTTKDYFMDHAVWRPPDENWMIIDGIDFAFVITGESNPDICCDGSISWRDVKPGDTVTATFDVGNCGETCSVLDWHVDTTTPGFGTWTYNPPSGTNLAAGSWVTVTATCVAPNQQNTEFTGNIKVVNSNDPSDYCEVPVYLKTPRTKSVVNQFFLRFLEKLFDQFPIFEWLLNIQ